MKIIKWLNKDSMKYLSLFTGIALTVILNLFIAILLYRCFEKYFFKSISILLILILLALVNSFYSIYKFIFDKD